MRKIQVKRIQSNSPVVGLGGLALMAGAIIVPLWGWSDLTKVLVAYAYWIAFTVLVGTLFGTLAGRLPSDVSPRRRQRNAV